MTQPTESAPKQLVKKGPIPNHILDAVAILALSGARVEEISNQVGLPLKTVSHLVVNKNNHKFNGIMEGYRERMLKVAVQHKLKLGGMMASAYDAVERALVQDRDAKLAKDTAFDLFKEVIPQPAKDKPESVGTSTSFVNIQLQQEVNTSFGETAGKFGELIETIAKMGTVDVHTKKGIDALPSAYTDTGGEPEDVVMEAEFVTEPEPDES